MQHKRVIKNELRTAAVCWELGLQCNAWHPQSANTTATSYDSL